LLSGEHLGGQEILKILVVCEDVDCVVRRLEVVTPSPESLEYGEELLVVCVVVELGAIECTAIKGHASGG
jgi:hypothetical protein